MKFCSRRRFRVNFARGLGIIFAGWPCCGAGLASASFLRSLWRHFVAGNSGGGNVKQYAGDGVSEGTYFTGNSETGESGASAADKVIVPIFRGMLEVINLAKDFSPIDALSTGRSITWLELLRAFGQIVCLLGGIIATAGIFIFNRRELATAQGTQ